ncbi:RRP1B protein, partial [Lanius ludovicianus]|nr:RRP1B protein [Lanius ludovicianus]
GGFSQEELLKIWKGLFYCMWMQDKPLLQEELAANISQLIHVFQNTETRHLFIQTFWQTMNREWNGIDNLRLDKYYMLMRLILRQSFEVLKRNEWDEGLVEPLLELLMKEVMDPDSNSPTGIKFHFIDIYLDELAKVGAKELTADQNLKFIEPFCKIAAKSKDRCVLHAVATGIFEMILDQSPFAIEDLMKELGTHSDEEDASEEGRQENEEVLKTKVADRNLSRKAAQSSEKAGDINENADDGIGTVLQFDYKAVADKIFEFASRKNTPSLNRKRLYKLVKKFQDLAEGIFPQDIPEDVSTDEDDDEFGRRKRKKKAVKPWQQNELEKVKEDKEELSSVKVSSVSQRKRKKRKKRDSPSADSGAADGNWEEGRAETCGSNASSQEKVPENNKERKKKKLLVNETTETTNVATDTRENHSISAQNSLTDAEQSKKSQLKNVNPKVQNVPAKPCQNGPASAAEGVSPSVMPSRPKAVKKKQKAGAVLVNGEAPVQQTDLKPNKEGMLGTLPRKAEAESVPSRKVTVETKLIGLEGMKVSSQNAATLKKKRKVKEVLNSVEANGVLETACKKSRKVESSAALSPLKKKKAKPGSDFVKFEKSTVPKAVFFRKARCAISSTRTSMQLNKLQSPSSKKVTFGLNKNMTAEFKKTDKSILVSPEGPSRVAFNPEQKPRHGVLKSPTVTPAKEPQMKRPFTMSAKKRPTAVDFF